MEPAELAQSPFRNFFSDFGLGSGVGLGAQMRTLLGMQFFGVYYSFYFLVALENDRKIE